jgi:HK97 family phage prohead protease
MDEHEEIIKAFSAPITMLPEKEGEFTAVINTFGVIDRHGEVVLPGAFPISKAVPMVGDHNPTNRTGKGVIESIGNEAVFRGQFFLNTVAGREAYETVKAMGDLQEWSFGAFATEAEWGDQDGKRVRFIKKLDPFEVSYVLKGANPRTRLLAIKGDGMTLSDQSVTVQAAVDDLVTRLRSLAELREKEGRVLSEANRQRLVSLKGALQEVITDIETLLSETARQPLAVVAHDGRLAEIALRARTLQLLID